MREKKIVWLHTHVRKSVNGGRLHRWKVRKGWLLILTTVSMCSAAEFSLPSISLPCWFLLLAVSCLFYLTRKRCKLDHTIWPGIKEIGFSSQCFYLTDWCCISVTVIDTRAHLDPYYNLTEYEYVMILEVVVIMGGEEAWLISFILWNYRAEWQYWEVTKN